MTLTLATQRDAESPGGEHADLFALFQRGSDYADHRPHGFASICLGQAGALSSACNSTVRSGNGKSASLQL